MKRTMIAILALACMSAGALAYDTPIRGPNRDPGDEGYGNRWFQPRAPRVGVPGTAFGFIPLTPAPDARPPSFDTPHKKRNE